MEEMRTRTTLIGAILVRRGDVDAMLCGTRIGAAQDSTAARRHHPI